MRTRDQIAAILQPLPEPSYACDIPLTSLERNLQQFDTDYGIDLAPDFQRGHVWTRAQQEAYMTALLRGVLAKGLTTIQWNSPAFGRSLNPVTIGLHPSQLVIVDGLQRLTAARAFLAGVITVADGLTYDEIKHSGYLGLDHQLRFSVLALRSRAEVLSYYLAINAGGTPHSAEEIARVWALWDQDKQSEAAQGEQP